MLKSLTTIAVCAAIATTGCGGGSDEPQATAGAPMHGPNGSEQIEPEPMNAEEKAVHRFAKDLYRQQDIQSVNCEKTGFSAAGDIYSCSLLTGDHQTTDPSDWVIARNANGEIVGALPNDSY
jgi:hypothetical protein